MKTLPAILLLITSATFAQKIDYNTIILPAAASNIDFSEKSDKKILHQLQLSLFSKKQTDKILAILTQTWNLDSNIKQPN